MVWVFGGELVGVVLKDGGFGIIVGGGMEFEFLRENIRKVKVIIINLFGVNLMFLCFDVED